MSFAMRQFLTPRAMLAPIIVMYIKQWDLTDPEVVFNIRCFYACSQSIMFLTMAFIRCAPFSCAAQQRQSAETAAPSQRAGRARGEHEGGPREQAGAALAARPDRPAHGQGGVDDHPGVRGGARVQGGDAGANSTTAADRRCPAPLRPGPGDRSPVPLPRAQFCFGAAVAVGFFHLYMGFLQPLALTGLFGPMTLVYKPMFKVHVLGEPAQGRLSRPYDQIEGTGGILETVMKTKKSLDQQSGQMTPAQEKKAAKKAARQAAKQARKVT